MSFSDLQGFLIAADLVAIDQAGEDLVEGVIKEPQIWVSWVPYVAPLARACMN